MKMKPIKHYGYRSAMAVGRCVTLPREMFYDLAKQWHTELGTFASNHETFAFLDERHQERYVTFTDGEAIFGTELCEGYW